MPDFLILVETVGVEPTSKSHQCLESPCSVDDLVEPAESIDNLHPTPHELCFRFKVAHDGQIAIPLNDVSSQTAGVLKRDVWCVNLG